MQGHLRAIAANGLWPQRRLYQVGLANFPGCTICGADGTGWHKFWSGPGTEHFRRQYGLPDTILRGVAAHPAWALWTHALVPDPRVWLPKPALADDIT